MDVAAGGGGDLGRLSTIAEAEETGIYSKSFIEEEQCSRATENNKGPIEADFDLQIEESNGDHVDTDGG